MMNYFEKIQQYSPKVVEAEAPLLINEVALLKDTVDNEILLRVTLANSSSNPIKAIAIFIKMWDVFGEAVPYQDKDHMEYVYQDISFEAQSIFGNTVPIKLPDSVRKVEVGINKAVFGDGTVWNANPDKNVHIQPQDLIEGTDDFIENISKGCEYPALFLYAENQECWQCTCGGVNLKSTGRCYRCGRERDIVKKEYTEQNVHAVFEEYRNKKEQEKKEAVEKERRELQEKYKREKEEQEREYQEAQKKRQEAAEIEAKKAKKWAIRIFGLMAIVIVAGVAIFFVNRNKYALKGDDLEKYKIAQNNYMCINAFNGKCDNEYTRKLYEYKIEEYDDNTLKDALRDQDFVKFRSMTLESDELFNILIDQYPEKYKDVITTLAKLQKTYDCAVMDWNVVTYLDFNDNKFDKYADEVNDVEKAITDYEKYKNNEYLNPSKVKPTGIKNRTSLSESDYKNLEIPISVLYYDDGCIKYIGEMDGDKMSGFGCTFYDIGGIPKDDNRQYSIVEKCGIFENGELVEERSSIYD